MIKLENVFKSYNEQIIFSDLNLHIPKNSTVAITGPSGSGKTTLLQLIMGMDAPNSGKIAINNLDLNTCTEQQKANIRNLEIGYVFQQHYLLPQCNALENILLPVLASPLKKAGKTQIDYARYLLQVLGILNLESKMPATLSGGESQRVALARALINKPGLLLADEPTGSLDTNNALAIKDLLLKLHSETGVTLVVVTHWNTLASAMQTKYAIENFSLVAQ